MSAARKLDFTPAQNCFGIGVFLTLLLAYFLIGFGGPDVQSPDPPRIDPDSIGSPQTEEKVADHVAKTDDANQSVFLFFLSLFGPVFLIASLMLRKSKSPFAAQQSEPNFSSLDAKPGDPAKEESR